MTSTYSRIKNRLQIRFFKPQTALAFMVILLSISHFHKSCFSYYECDFDRVT